MGSECGRCRSSGLTTVITFEHALADGTVTDFGKGPEGKAAAEKHKSQVGGVVRKRRNLVRVTR